MILTKLIIMHELVNQPKSMPTVGPHADSAFPPNPLAQQLRQKLGEPSSPRFVSAIPMQPSRIDRRARGREGGGYAYQLTAARGAGVLGAGEADDERDAHRDPQHQPHQEPHPAPPLLADKAGAHPGAGHGPRVDKNRS
jgi:hypothetical protein